MLRPPAPFAADRYDRMQYRRSGRSGLKLPAISLGLWQNFGGDRPLETHGDRPPRLRPRDHALRPGQQLRAAVRLGGGELRPPARDDLRALPRRARDLDEGRLRHVARPVRRVGVAQVPARLARPVALPAGRRLRRHLLFAPPRPDTPLEETMGALHLGRSAGEGALRGHLVLLGRADAGGGFHPALAGHAGADPSALVLDPEPLDRGRPARRTRREGDRLHRVLAARAGLLTDRYLGGIPSDSRASRDESLPQSRSTRRRWRGSVL